LIYVLEKIEDTKKVIRSRKSKKNRHCHVVKNKENKESSTKHYTEN